MNDREKCAWLTDNLYTAAVCDILDEMGRRNQAMHHRLRPLDPEQCKFAGRARTVQWINIEYEMPGDPYGKEIDVMDALKPGEVIVHSTDYAGGNAPWGELMSTAATCRGAVGCVCDSQIRDCARIKSLNFPVFYTGIRPLDSKGRGYVFDYDVLIRCGEVLVHPGDLIFADFDGVVAIPRELEDEVIERAKLKAELENHSREGLLQGRLLRDVYNEYGAL